MAFTGRIVNNTYFTMANSDVRDRIDVEIGDSKQPTAFYPQVKVMRWDNEVNFSVRLVTAGLTAESVGLVTDTIVWSKGAVDAKFYEVPATVANPEGGYEFEVILNQKPETNVVAFTINTKGLDFLYQHPLTEAEVRAGCICPDNVAGSYAVYATAPLINREGGKLYRTGKVGHIFRPQIVDAKGLSTWGTLSVDKNAGILMVTIPQVFLDSATYPVRHAAGLTFGFTTAGAKSANWGQTFIGATDVVAGANGTVTSMSQHLKGTHNVQLGLYDTASPANLIGNTGTISAPGSTANWVSGAASFSVAAVNYRLAFHSDNSISDMLESYDDSTGTAYKSSVTYGTWPATVTWNSTSSTARWSIYATYTSGGGGGISIPVVMHHLRQQGIA